MLNNKTLQSLAASVAFVFSATSSAMAVEIPTVAQPGIVIQNIEEERRVPSKFENIFAIDENDINNQNLSDKKVFTLQQVIIDDSTAYAQEQVNSEVKNYLGTDVSFADLFAISKQLTRKYRADGYLFSRVVLSPQKIKDGIVHMQTIEAKITDVTIVGDYTDDNGLIQDFANKIKTEGHANTKTLERYILLIDDLPGIKARSLMQPAKTSGGVEVIITIEQDKFEGSAAADNRGSEYLGQGRGTLVGAVNSLFGVHDRTTVRGLAAFDSDELRFADISHEEQVGTEGGKIKGRLALTSTSPGKELELLNVDGSSTLFDLEYAYPMIRSRQENLNLVTSFNVIESSSDILGSNVSEDRLRYVTAGANYDFTDSAAGVNLFDFEVAHGLDILNSTEDGLGRTRSNGTHDFIRFNASATRIQDLPDLFSLRISAAGQYSPDELLASEEFTVGGQDFGRAYDSGEIAGDRGVSGLLELRYGGSTEDYDYLESYQLYSFYDIGRVWNQNIVLGEQKRESIASLGVGVRFNVINDISGYVELGKPIVDEVSAENGDGSRIFFSLLKRF